MFRLIFLIATLSFPAFAGGPAVWKVEDKDTPVYLLGSVHVLKPGTVWMQEELQDILLSADRIYLEISLKEQTPDVMRPLISKYGLLPKEDSLANHISTEVYDALSAELKSFGMKEKQFSRLKPWSAATLYSSFKFAKLGFNAAVGVEATIASLASAKGIPIEGLETAEFQIKMFDDLGAQEEQDLLEQMLADRASLSKTMETMTEVWSSGNTKKLAELFEQAFSNSPSLKQSILIERNNNWAEEIHDIVRSPGKYAVVVGSAHMLGQGSLIQALEEDGLSVTRVN